MTFYGLRTVISRNDITFLLAFQTNRAENITHDELLTFRSFVFHDILRVSYPKTI